MEAAVKKRQEPFFWKERRHPAGGSRASLLALFALLRIPAGCRWPARKDACAPVARSV